MPPVVVGQCDPTPQNSDVSYDRNGAGWQTVYLWQGSRAACEALIPTLQAAFYDQINIRNISPSLCELSASRGIQEINPGPEVAEFKWEVVGTEATRSLLSHPAFEGISAAAQEQQDIGKKLIEDAGTIADATADGSWAKLTSDQQILVHLSKKGVDGYIDFGVTIKKSISSTDQYPTKESHNRIGTFLSEAEMVADEGLPADAFFTLPSPIARPDEGTGRDQFTWGYLKERPTSTRNGFGKWAQTLEYTWGYWPNLLYSNTYMQPYVP